MTRQERQFLKDLQLKHKMEKYPNTPPHMLALNHWNDNSANELTKSVIAFLQFNKDAKLSASTQWVCIAKSTALMVLPLVGSGPREQVHQVQQISRPRSRAEV